MLAQAQPGRQALLVLAYLRKGETFAELAAGFGIGTATAWRYVSETVALLAARSPGLNRALAPGRPGTLRGDRRHVNRDRPGRRGPAVLLRQAPPPRHEPAGHLRSRRRDPVGLRASARCRARPDRGPDLGHPARTRGVRAGGAGGQGIRPLPGSTCASPTGDGASPPRRRTPTARTPSWRRPGRTRQRTATDLDNRRNSAAAPGRPGSWRKLSTSFKPARSGG